MTVNPASYNSARGFFNFLSNPNMSLQGRQPYAHGGHSREHEDDYESENLDLVHLSPHEVHELDEMQGGPEYTRDGVRMYKRLSDMLHHPHIHEHLHVASERRRLAAGGMSNMPEHVNEMAHNGLFHDTKMAYMPRKMQSLLDHMIGGASHNPVDGKKQYFLGDLMGSMKSALGGFLANPMTSVNSMSGAPEGTQGPGFSDLKQMAKSALGSFVRGGMQNIANNYANDKEGPGGYYGNMGRNMLAGLAQRGLYAMDNPGTGPGIDFSRQGLYNMGRNALQTAGRYAANKAFDAADRYLAGPQMDEKYGGEYQGAPGSFENMMSNMGSAYGRRVGGSYGSRYGQQMGGYAGGMAGRMAGMVPEGEGYNPEEMSGRFQDLGTERGGAYGGAYGARAGSQVGSRAGTLAGRLMDRGFNYLDRNFPMQQQEDPYAQEEPMMMAPQMDRSRLAPNRQLPANMSYVENPMYRGQSLSQRSTRPSRFS